MELILKRCQEADLIVLSNISRRTFEEAFEDANNPDDFKNYIDRAFSENQLSRELRNHSSHFYFVYVGLDLVGYFKLNFKSAQTEFKNQNSIELERIYVLKEFQGNKIGQSVLQKVGELALSKNKDFVWLGVWQKNLGAIRFYEKHGFVKVGTHPYFIGTDEQTDWLMKYSL